MGIIGLHKRSINRILYIALMGFLFVGVNCIAKVIDKVVSYSLVGGIIWVLLFCFLIIVQTHEMKASANIKTIIVAGTLFRLVFAFFRSCIPGALPSFIANDDEYKFVMIATKYFYGIFDQYSTNFPYLLNVLFNIFGLSVFTIRIVFIYMWYLGLILISKTAGKLKGRNHQFLVAFYCLMPWPIYIGTAVLRESPKQLAIMLSVFFLIKWMECGKPLHLMLSVASAVPAVWLHNGEVGVLVVIFITWVFWNPSAGRWYTERINIKHIVFALAILMFPLLYDCFTTLFPGKFIGPFSIRGLIDRIEYTEARTNYVYDVSYADPVKFVLWTIYRMIYFWISPTPRFWSQDGDILLFFFDTVPWIALFIYILVRIRKDRENGASKVAYIFWGIVTFIFAWGTRNAGTAMRHRDHFAGVFVLLAVFAGRRESRCTGDNKE